MARKTEKGGKFLDARIHGFAAALIGRAADKEKVVPLLDLQQAGLLRSSPAELDNLLRAGHLAHGPSIRSTLFHRKKG